MQSRHGAKPIGVGDVFGLVQCNIGILSPQTKMKKETEAGVI